MRRAAVVTLHGLWTFWSWGEMILSAKSMNVELNPQEIEDPSPRKIMRYFVHDNAETLGPFTLAQLQGQWRRRKLTEAAKVCVAGSEEWVEIITMKEQLDFTPVDRHFTVPVRERKRQRLSRRGKRGRGTIWLVVIGILLAVALVAGIIYFAGVA